MLKSIFSFVLIGTLLLSSNPIANIGADKATADEVSQSVVTLDEVFVSETGILADGKSGDYVGVPSEDFEPGQTFGDVSVDKDNVMTDIEGTKIGTYSEEMTDSVTEEELARPRMFKHEEDSSVGAGQSIEINDFRAVIRSGAVLNSEGDYVRKVTESEDSNTFTYRMVYALSGVGECDPNTISFTVPKSILRDRNGNLADICELSVSRWDEDDLTEDNLYVYKEDEDNFVIFNRLSCTAAQSGFIELSYTTSKNSFEYADYMTSGTYNEKGGSDPFQAVINVDRGEEHLSRESDKIPVYLDTTAVLTSVKKTSPLTDFSSWNDSWGDAVKPSNDSDYYYLVWTVAIQADATQPYNLSINDSINADDTLVLGCNIADSSFKPSFTISNLRQKYPNTYILTAHKKETYDALLAADKRYTINNTVSVTLTPADGVDAKTVQSSSAPYTKQIHTFEFPIGHFYARKYGLDISNSYVKNSNKISDYSLIEFSEDASSTINSLKYYANVYGHPYPWTLPEGVTENQIASDPDAYYGQNPVTYRLSDNSFYLKEISEGEYSEKLTVDDYELESVLLAYYLEKATYNNDEKRFNIQTIEDYSDSDVINIYVEVGGSGNYVKIADYALKTKQYTFTAEADSIVDKTKTEEDELYFKSNVTGYRLEITNAHWYTKISACPHVKLKHSATVDSYVSKAVSEGNVTKLCLMNVADSKVMDHNNKDIIGFTREGVDYITGKNRESYLTKSYAGSTNNPKNHEYTVTWNTSFYESYLDNNGTYNVRQASGVFYDLIPDGAVFKNNSLSVYADGKKLEPWKYTVTVDTYYRNQGRTLLKIDISEPAEIYRFVYSTVHSWDSFVDFSKTLLNSVAYETGNVNIGGGKTTADSQSITESELMSNLDPDAGDSKRFLYAEATHISNAIASANLGLSKSVRSEYETSFSRSSTAFRDKEYYYKIRYATDDITKANDLIAFDSLENYTVTSGDERGKSSEWRGTLLGIDLHQLKQLGIAPKVYYSTVPGLSIKQHNDISDASYWILSDDYTGELSDVKAIAVDMRTASDGSEYVLPQNTAVEFMIRMRAPHTVDTESELPASYNEIYLQNNTINAETGEESDTMLIRHEYTKVILKVKADLELLKVNSENRSQVAPGIKFELSGKSVYGTSVNETLCSDDDGSITRKDLERGEYTLKEIDSGNDYFLNETVFNIVIDKNGNLTINGSDDTSPYVIENPPRVHGDLEFLKKGTIDGVTNTVKLTGAQFKLEGTSYYGNDIILFGTSGDDGVVRIDNIERGVYELTETVAAKGYIATREKYRVVCNEHGIVTLYKLENGTYVEAAPSENGYSVILNEPLHNFRLVKYDPLTNSMLGGAEFKLLGKSDYGTPVNMTVVSSSDTNDEGIVAFRGLESGTYTLRETKAPENYQPDNTIREVKILPDGTITISGLTKMPSDWQGGLYANCFGVPNTRELEGEITITKRWLDADGNPITDSSSLPVPIVHVESKEPVFDRRQQDAYVDKDDLRSSLRRADTFQKTTVDYTLDTLPEGAVRVDDRTTRASIYVWKEGTDAYWWSDARAAHLPDSCSSLFNGLYLESVDLSGFDTSNVRNMVGMFEDCSALKSLVLSGLDTSNVEDMTWMFQNCSALESLDLSGLDTSNVEYTSWMFDNCSALETLDLSGWDLSNAYRMWFMFNDCTSLKSIVGLSGWNIGNADDIAGVFQDCESLETLDLSDWNTGNVTDMSGMFSGCTSLKSIVGLSGWDTGNVTDMRGVFNNCAALKSLDLSGWNTGNVEYMSAMFEGCRVLETIYVGDNWSTENVISYDAIFQNVTFIEGGNGTTYDSSHDSDITYARVDNPPVEPGYFTYKEFNSDEPVGASLFSMAQRDIRVTEVTAKAETEQEEPVGESDSSGVVEFSQTTNSEMGTESEEGKWIDNGDGTWTYRMKVFKVPADYYVWEEQIPGFKCDLDDDTGVAVLHYKPDNEENNVIITNKRAETDTCSLTLKKVLAGDYTNHDPVDFENMEYRFSIILTGEGLSGKKLFGRTLFTDGRAWITLKGGEQMAFTNIPAGVSYSVYEFEENYQGLITTTYSPSGTLNAESNKDVVFTVTNNVIEHPKRALDITKTVLPYDGGELDEEDLSRVFTFDVDLHDDSINGLYGELIFTNGKSTAYLKHGETVSITGLPSSDSYTVTELENSLYTCDQAVKSGALTVGETAHVTFTNTKLPEEEKETGGFTLKKLVDGKTTDNKFAFNISFNDLDKNAVYTLSDGTSFNSDINGSANLTIQLAHGESVKFSDLPVGAEYTVSEQACNYYASYEISGTDRVVPLSAENTETDKQLTTSKITVQKDDDITIAYTNTDRRYDVRIVKVDENDEYVTDAVLYIFEKDNESNVIEKPWTTTDNYHTAQIPQGTYILREKQAPFGYMKAPDIEFTVNADGTITSGGENVLMLKMVDKPVVLAVTGAVGVIPVVIAATSLFIILLAAVVIKNRKNTIKEKRSTTK